MDMVIKADQLRPGMVLDTGAFDQPDGVVMYAHTNDAKQVTTLVTFDRAWDARPQTYHVRSWTLWPTRTVDCAEL